MAKSIYVHIPFCINICSYCDFTKFLFHHHYVESYTNQLIKHINSHDIIDANTIYIGGGTPTCLPLPLLENILKALKPYTKNVIEYTIESNVENINLDLIYLLKKYKINRISIGVQTFNDAHLKQINRNHTYNEILKKIDLLVKNDITNISIDLIYGLPNQTLEEWKEDLMIATNLPIKHLSIYSLMIEKHTLFYVKKIKERDEDFLDECYQYAYNYLNKKGFSRYEISNFAISEEYESKHNLVYWRDEEYIAFGVGASGYENNIRYTYTKSLQEYLKNYDCKDIEIIDQYNHKEEFIMLHLRTKYGLPICKYNQIFNSDFLNEYNSALKKLILNNYINIKDDILYVHEDKVYLLNQIIVELLSCL